MQDGLKHRIFDKINKVMRYDDFIVTSNGFAGELFDLNTSDDENTLFIMRSLDTYKQYSEIMRCTGLYDKECKLIYEGDIVKVGNNIFEICYEISSFMIVTNSNIEAIHSFKNSWNDNVYPLSQLYYEYQNEEGCIEQLEIIGNKFENPELLESL